MKLAAITCTGDRPEAFALCRRWMENQEYKDFTWIVIDDGAAPIEDALTYNFETKVQHYVYHRLQPLPGENTLARNFTKGLEIAKALHADYIAVIEDDDYYGPRYLLDMKAHLDCGYMAVGEKDVTYFHTSNKCYNLRNRTYAPLAATCFRKELIGLMVECIDDPSPYKTFDIKFWREVRNRSYTNHIPQEYNFNGVKGMPGRKGIGKGHTPGVGWKDISIKWDFYLPDDFREAYTPLFKLTDIL